MAAVRHHLQQTQDRRVERVVEPSYLAGAAVHGQGVLRQVVSTETEQVDLIGKLVGHQGNGRHFDHDPQLAILRKSLPRLPQLVFGLIEQRAGTPQLVQARNHRQQDLHFAARARP